MQRRQFLKLTAALSAAGVLPIWSRGLQAQNRPALPVPDILQPDARQQYTLTAKTGYNVWRGKSVPGWGYNGNLLGPAVRLQRGKAITFNLQNQLPEATTVHWHGLAIPGEADGGPMASIASGGKRQVTFTPDQPAATCWYHPHLHGRTGFQVAQGLGGLLLLSDPEADALRLPAQWGVDDIPLIFQDKQLTADNGRIDYQLDVMRAAVGWFGDLMLTNGVEYPVHASPRGWLRLRLLNGCNARTLHIAASDRRPLYVIASDGGLLAEPVKVADLLLLPGERFEVLVDTQDRRAFDLVTLPVQQMGMTLAPFDQPLPLVRIQPLLIQASATLPDSLAVLPALPALDGIPQRELRLTMDPQLDQQGMQQLMQRYGHQAMAGMAGHQHMQHGGGHGSPAADIKHGNKINGLAFDMRKPQFDVPRGQTEKWTITGEGDAMLHPFHIHGTQFRIISENGRPPAAHRQGWKDIVHVEGGRSEVLLRFDHPAAAEHAYMAHCHLLEHEDSGMMLGFTVSG